MLNELSADHTAAKEELEALQEYMAKLEDQCVAQPEPYEARKQQREKEIQGLREAASTLNTQHIHHTSALYILFIYKLYK